ncbi:very low-density lipoprotein receptor-like isoform X4 [Haliotis cracherodii]|uniref:very low-density lipoprotein receptor-like isoform X4 n=1 Tax=Haliotis cracherodii TaxID=6455 RepID=UPI0039E91892
MPAMMALSVPRGEFIVLLIFHSLQVVTSQGRTCGSNEAMCADSKQCIPNMWLCDKDRDCADGSDETACDIFICKANQTRCADGSACVQNRWLCDGDSDCADGSDEGPQCSNHTKTCNVDSAMCSDDNQCIPVSWLCDGEEDCFDKSDERNCAGPTCSVAETMCKNTNQCIRSSQLCDGKQDCPDASDENGCAAVYSLKKILQGFKTLFNNITLSN